MEPKKELDEQTYQSNKKKLNMIALGVLITAVVIGLGLIIVPRFTNSTSAPKVISDSELNAQIATIESQYTKKTGDPGWFEELKVKNDKISAAQKAKSDAEFEAFGSKADNDFATFGMTGAGAMVIFVGIMIAGGLLWFANFRKVAGYAAQGVMPVAKEVVTEMAPVMGAAAGSAMEAATPAIARSSDTILTAAAPGIGKIAKEVKKGMNEADKDSKK